ncbi:MAG: P-II family nitrogen regulator [bacterium]|nr:P-II family nitrogen regulator [bacterium]
MIELCFVITNLKNDKILKRIYEKYNMPFNLVTFAKGTASDSLLEYFGLEDVKKYIYFSLINSNMKGEILNTIDKELNLKSHGNGICFVVPLSSSTKYILDNLKEKDMIKDKNNKVDINKDKNNKEHHLVIAITNEGYSDNVMNAAKKSGAFGGTLIKGRSLLKNDKKKEFLGFSIEPEKDIVLIVTTNKDKKNIMDSIVKDTGLKTKGNGIIFSLPISDAIGLFDDN